MVAFVPVDLKDKVALITGGKRIGLVVAGELAARGVDVALSYARSRTEAEQALTFALEWARARQLVAPGDRVVLLRGTIPGNAVHNALLVQEVG